MRKLILRLFFKSFSTQILGIYAKMHFHFEQAEKCNKLIRPFHVLMMTYYHRKIYHKYACDITPSCKLGKIEFRHPTGIVLGGGAILADGVLVHQNVTFGALRFGENRRGIPCHQVVGENTIISAGAKILGDVVIGKNCIIGANAVVTKSVPDNAVVVGVNRIIHSNDVSGLRSDGP